MPEPKENKASRIWKETRDDELFKNGTLDPYVDFVLDTRKDMQETVDKILEQTGRILTTHEKILRLITTVVLRPTFVDK